MIKKLIKLFKKQPKEPTYNVEDLYIGEIIKLHNKSYSNGFTNYTYQTIKKVAVLTKESYDTYIHLKSNQKLYTHSNAEVGDYAVFSKEIHHLTESYHLRTIDNKVFDKNTNLTLTEIIKMEDELNNQNNINENIFN